MPRHSDELLMRMQHYLGVVDRGPPSSNTIHVSLQDHTACLRGEGASASWLDGTALHTTATTHSSRAWTGRPPHMAGTPHLAHAWTRQPLQEASTTLPSLVVGTKNHSPTAWLEHQSPEAEQTLHLLLATDLYYRHRPTIAWLTALLGTKSRATWWNGFNSDK